MDKETGEVIRYKHLPTDDSSLSNNSIRAILMDSFNSLWVGVGFNGGLNKMNYETGKFNHYLLGHDITSIYQDSYGVLWAGTMTGLFKYDSKTDEFLFVNDESKGNNINSVVISLLEDTNNNLWISTSTGIYSFNDKRNSLIHFGKERGVFFEDKDLLMSGFVYQTSDGRLVFNKADGFYSFSPEKTNTKIREQRLLFDALWVNNRKIESSTNLSMFNSFYDMSEVRLSHKQNVFAFGFNSIDYNSFDENDILYKLENYDDSWHNTNGVNRVNYFKVPSGEYIFHIKVVNKINGEWTEKQIKVTVLKPWWKTWWAYSIYSILILLILWFTNKFQREKVIRSEREKAQKKELKQAKKIKKAYAKLKSTQSQLVQSEKMASLGELTAGIAHEIQNPLNFINNFSEVSDELLEEMNEELDNKEIEEAKVIGTYLKANLKKINFHGKRIDVIIKGMLQYSSRNNGVKELTDINELANENLKLAYNGLRVKDKSFNATLVTNFSDKIDKINVVPQDIGRVIINLVTNAFYAVNEKRKADTSESLNLYEPKVVITSRMSKKNILLMVSDNGNGIPQKLINKIFQPFFTTKPTGQGTGLGLSLSYDIIKGHGGDMVVDIDENNQKTLVGTKEGTTIIISLPIS